MPGDIKAIYADIDTLDVKKFVRHLTAREYFDMSAMYTQAN
jgi:hypothetical protein